MRLPARPRTGGEEIPATMTARCSANTGKDAKLCTWCLRCMSEDRVMAKMGQAPSPAKSSAHRPAAITDTGEDFSTGIGLSPLGKRW